MNLKLNFIVSRKLILVLLSVFLFSCNKEDYGDFDVKTLSVKLIGGDTVQVEGVVTNSGSSEIVYSGFCMSADSVPLMKDNQILLNGNVGKFKANILNLEPEKVYYFRTFAANEFTYIYGNIIRFKVPFPLSPEVPCTLDNNKIIDNGSLLSIDGIYPNETPTNGGVFQIRVSCYFSAQKEFYFEFMQKPRNGIYTTSNYELFTYNTKNVFVYKQSGFSEYYVNPGCKIYITTDSISGKMSMSFCELYYSAFSNNYLLKGKVTF